MGLFGRKKKVDEGAAFDAWDTGGTAIPLSINDETEAEKVVLTPLEKIPEIFLGRILEDNKIHDLEGITVTKGDKLTTRFSDKRLAFEVLATQPSTDNALLITKKTLVFIAAEGETLNDASDSKEKLKLSDGKEKYVNDQSRHNPITKIVVKQLSGKTPLNVGQVAMIFSGQLSIVSKGEKILDDDRSFEIVGLSGSSSILENGLITDKTAWSLLDGYVPPPPEEPTYTVDEVKATEWLEKGNELWKSDKHEEAMSCYDKVITMFPESALAWDNKGRLAYVMKLYDLSIEYMQQVMRFQEKHYDPLCTIANAHLEMKNFDKAMEYSDKAIGVWPKRQQAWEIMVATLKESGREEDVKVCQRVWDELQNITTTEEAQEFMKSQREDMRTGD